MSSSPELTATPASAEHADAGVWSAIREALRGSHRDFTQGSIARAILILAVPMVLEMGMESVFAVADIFYVAHLGADAVATVGLTESLLTIVYTLAMGLSIGASATVARRIGERDPEGAARVAAQALGLGALVSTVLAVAGALAAPRLLALMGASPAVIASGTGYTRMMLAGNASIVLLFLANAIFRGAGDAAIAMRSLWLANGINIVLGPILIFGPGPLPALGVVGAAIATTTGRSIGVVYAVSRLFRRGGRLELRRRHLRVSPAIMAQLLRLSGSGTVQVLVGAASWIALVRIIATFGSDALAGYTIAIRIVLFALLPSWGMSNAAATMVGQALGARRPERAERAVWMAARYNAVVLGVIGIAFVALAPVITRLFTSDPAVLRYAADGLRVVSSTFVLYGFGMVFTQAFNGAGDTWTPTALNFAIFWLFEIPLAWFLAMRAGMQSHGVYLAIAIAFSTMAVVGGVLFRRGRWKLQRV